VKDSRLFAAIIAGVEGKFERVRDCKFMVCVKVLKLVEETFTKLNYLGRSNTIVSV